MTIKSLPQAPFGIIEAYWNLKISKDRAVRCPYFRNPANGKEKWGLTAYSGKGSPQDIEDELKIIEKLEGKDFSEMQESEIRDIMEKRKLGIECSGFITRILDAWVREAYKKSICSVMKFRTRGLGRIFSMLRPYTHISVQTLVHADNAHEIKNIGDLAPGDIINFNSEIDHAILITETEKDEIGNIKRAKYAHSVLEKTSGGVKRGTIEFINSGGNLLSQKWSEEPDTGSIAIDRGKPRVYRLHIIKKIVSLQEVSRKGKSIKS